MLLQMAQILEAIASSKPPVTPESEKGEWAKMSTATGEFTIIPTKDQIAILKQFKAIVNKNSPHPVMRLVQIQCLDGILLLTASDLSTWLEVQFVVENREIEFCHKVSPTIANLLIQGGGFRFNVGLDRITVNGFPYDVELKEEEYPLPPWQDEDACEEFLFSLDMAKEWKSVNSLVKLAGKNAVVGEGRTAALSRTLAVSPAGSRWVYTNGHLLMDRRIPIAGFHLKKELEPIPWQLFQLFSGVKASVKVYELEREANRQRDYTYSSYLASGDGFTICRSMLKYRYPDIDALLVEGKTSSTYKCTVQIDRQELLALLRSFAVVLENKGTIDYLDTVGLCVEKGSLTVALLQVAMREISPKDLSKAKYLLADNSIAKEVKSVSILNPKGEQRDMILFLSFSYLTQIVKSFAEAQVSIPLDNWQVKHHSNVKIIDGLHPKENGGWSNCGCLAPIRFGSSALGGSRWN